jgi:hypothetical protein
VYPQACSISGCQLRHERWANMRQRALRSALLGDQTAVRRAPQYGPSSQNRTFKTGKRRSISIRIDSESESQLKRQNSIWPRGSPREHHGKRGRTIRILREA